MDIMNGTSWHSYSSIYNLGHYALEHLFDGPVVVEEKVDGSQFSFGLFRGELKIRSKGKEMDIHSPEKMFNHAVETVKKLHEEGHLREGYTYRGEYLSKPKHNTLIYGRIPNKYIVLYDINIGPEHYLGRKEKEMLAQSMGLEVVPQFTLGEYTEEHLRWVLDHESFLGGCKIEGFVIKNYQQFGPDSKVLMGKFVSADFREIHKKEWKKLNPTQSDIIQQLGERYCAEGRWHKAIHYLRDNGDLKGSPTDIGPLIKAIPADVRKECEEEMKDILFKWAWPQVSRLVVKGFPEFYKDQLLKNQFKGES